MGNVFRLSFNFIDKKDPGNPAFYAKKKNKI